jgi:tRNA (guanine-N(7)-)-methyltransferase subunit TRM82
MPKRPCSIVLTQDSTTIISADKFGDVYSVPLHPSSSTSAPGLATPEPGKLYKPAANELTIHSQRNLKALENQRRQQLQQVATEKPEFEGTLLLGHVSMLTCLIMAQVDGRDYILTADRDEHIRVSRGGRQTHVVEGFCLGHSQFVTCLCIPQSRSEVLISGGGEDDLFVWEWLTGKLLRKVNLKQRVLSVLKDMSKSSVEIASVWSQPIEMVISKIIHVRASGDSNSIDIILVTVER